MSVIAGDTYAERAIAGTLSARNNSTGLNASASAAALTALAARFKTQRVTTGSIAGTSSAEVTVTWTQAFADTNYTVAVDVVEGTATTDTIRILKIVSFSASQVVIRVHNDNGTARTGTLHLTAIHD